MIGAMNGRDNTGSNAMATLPLRLMPGDDLRRGLERAAVAQGWNAAFVIAGIGSLRPASIRLAGADEPLRIDQDLEMLSLSGSLGAGGAHLHMSIADGTGRVIGGHVAYGCTVRTTAEVLLVLLPDWHFSREFDAPTGSGELVVRASHPPAKG